MAPGAIGFLRGNHNETHLRNTTLGEDISCPKAVPTAFDLTKPGFAQYLHTNSTHHKITQQQPYALAPNDFILAQTREEVGFPIRSKKPCYCARVEGKSSIARCGILVHFTAPTIHAGFEGRITLELINLGKNNFLLTPGMAICQLVVEQVEGVPMDAPNQFKNQKTPSGTKG